jgi:nicotinamidase-related amidase
MITALDKNTALVLIDLQQGIIRVPLAHPINEVLQNAAKLVAAFRNAGLPIVIVNVDPRTNPANGLRKDAKAPASTFDEAFLAITPEIITAEGDSFITKNNWNAFTNPALNETLKKLRVTGIVLAGVATSIGVEGTARAASENGYNISFAQDAMTDRFADAHAHSLKYIFPRLGEVDDTDKIIEKLV